MIAVGMKLARKNHSLTMKKNNWSLFVLAALCLCLCDVCIFVILRPVPDTDYLYAKYPELKGKLPDSMIGTRVQLFIDPSLYYKFDANEAEATQLAGLLGLTPVDTASQCFRPTGLFWQDVWWHPNLKSTSRLFNAYRNGDDICLMYDFQEKVIYLYIQNT
jgi:hypothetical protein